MLHHGLRGEQRPLRGGAARHVLLPLSGLPKAPGGVSAGRRGGLPGTAPKLAGQNGAPHSAPPGHALGLRRRPVLSRGKGREAPCPRGTAGCAPPAAWAEAAVTLSPSRSGACALRPAPRIRGPSGIGLGLGPATGWAGERLGRAGWRRAGSSSSPSQAHYQPLMRPLYSVTCNRSISLRKSLFNADYFICSHNYISFG